MHGKFNGEKKNTGGGGGGGGWGFGGKVDRHK